MTVKTGYPFLETVAFTIKAEKAFTLELRIPAWCEGATVTTGGDTSAQPEAEVDALPAGVCTPSRALMSALQAYLQIEMPAD